MADKKQVEEERRKVWGTILYLANTYTGAKFDKPLNIDQTYIIDASADLVFNYFGSLVLDELKIAFEMAVAGKLDVNLETYYGKFSVKTLTTVLNAYNSFRSSIKLEFDKLQKARAVKLTDEEIKERNAETFFQIKDSYLKLVESYKTTGDFDRQAIFGYWGEVLVKNGVIFFDLDGKKAIYQEAREMVINDLKIELSNTTHPNDRRALIKILENVKNKVNDEDFNCKVKIKYGYLIVIKSILAS